MTTFVHANPAGRIMSVTSAPEPFDVPGLVTVVTDLPNVSDMTHKVVDGVVVEMTTTEKADLRRPTLDDVKGRRNAQLMMTDYTQTPDGPPSLNGASRQEWAAYRKALRDLGQYATAAEWLANWPTRPDGLNPIADLVARQNA